MQEEKRINFGIYLLIWNMLLVTQFIYVYVAYMSLGDFILEPPTESFLMLFTFLAFASFAMSFLIQGLLIKSKKIENEIEALQVNFAPYIVRLVLVETALILGLVMSFQVQKNYILPFFILSVLGFALSFPRKNQILKTIGHRG